MCGIAGAYSLKTDITKVQNIVEQVVRDQYRRGPDYQKIDVIYGNSTDVVLGHNRLSIIDPSPQAHQPMWDIDHEYCLVFNGEIYNYVDLKAELAKLNHAFKTHSDSEVVIEAFKEWGLQAVNRFNGMFAFALLDARHEKLYLFRDRFGVKPLYYYIGKDVLYFASTPVIAKALALPPDLTYLARGLQFEIYDEGDAAPYVGLKALKPGHFVTVEFLKDGSLGISTQEYYNLVERVSMLSGEMADKSIQDMIDMVISLLKDSVKIRLGADVPLGVSLSGGLDSSVVAGLASKMVNNISGFTFSSPNDPKTEGPIVKTLEDHLGISIYYVSPKMSEIVNAYFESLKVQNAPFTSGGVVGQFFVYSAARQAGVKVLLGGQGGDEIFMGYRKFLIFYLKQLLSEHRYMDALVFSVDLFQTMLAEMRNVNVYWRGRHRYTHKYGRASILRLPTVACEGLGFDPTQPLWIRQAKDITYASLPTLLRYEDRNSMGNSVESRLPFVDYRLAEMALALPVSVKLKDGYGKWIVRQAVDNIVPDIIRWTRYKRGFDVQQDTWIDNGLGDAIRSALKSRSSVISEFIDNDDSHIDHIFSNSELKKRPLAFAEATTLIWLGDQIN